MKPRSLFLYSNDVELDYFLKQYTGDEIDLLVKKIDINKISEIQNLLGTRLDEVTVSFDLYNKIIEVDSRIVLDVLKPITRSFIIHIF